MTSMDEMRQWAQEARDQVERVNGGAANGMTLRDYFAAAVFPALYAANDIRVLHPANKDSAEQTREGLALAAYRIADALIEARAPHESEGA